MQLIDTHAHIFMEHFDDDREHIFINARKTGVSHIFCPNVDTKTVDRLHDTAEKFNCYPFMGLHPSSVKENFEKDLLIIEDLLFNKNYYGVGEIGIDLYWDDNKKFKDLQIEAFRIQVQWAKKLKIPVIIHARKAFAEIFSVIDKENDNDLTGIFHCFTGKINEAKHILEYGGFKLGIGGVVTYKNTKLPKTLQQIDPENIVLETDSPFLPPVPHRGERNEPAYIINVAEKLAEIYSVTLDEIAKITTENAKKLFKIS